MADLPHIEAILDRQAKSWEKRNTLADASAKAARDALLHLQEGPWLSVSRQWGSGGVELAREVGRRLGWQVYDREILTAIAEHTHTREAVLADLDRVAMAPLKDYIAHLIVPGAAGHATYLEELTRVIWGLAKKGQAIILGRGGNWFLDSRFGLRVRIVAPLDQRVAAVAKSSGLSEDDARRKLLETDHDRKAFVRQVFGRDIDDPLGYDAMLSLERMTPQAAADVIVGLLRSKLAAVG
jgi:cytidylate kinase